jgi:hypothetical protein
MADGIYDQLCPVVEKEEPDWFEDCRRGIATAISSSLPALEALLGITQPNSQFREGVIDAVLFCNLTHRFPPKRRSEIRKELADISDDAAALVKAHQRLMSRLEQTSGIYPPIKSRFLELADLHRCMRPCLSWLASTLTPSSTGVAKEA